MLKPILALTAALACLPALAQNAPPEFTRCLDGLQA
ncbi:MAG: hypothetical protein ACI9M6_001891, partial [Hydrogenophaga sp.]